MITFKNQPFLPRLPLPNPSSVAAALLLSLKPLIPKNNSEIFSHSESIISKAFKSENKMTSELHNRLLNLYNTHPSWLSELWLNQAYLVWRCPSAVNVNWWAALRKTNTNFGNNPQITRAAGLTNLLARAHISISQNKWKPDNISRKPLCMHQLRLVFSGTRIPFNSMDRWLFFKDEWKLNPDEYYSYYKSNNFLDSSLIANSTEPHVSSSRHIVVFANDLVFKIPVLIDDQNSTNISPLPIFVLERLMKNILKIANNSSSSSSYSEKNNLPVGSLTAENRDIWANLRPILLNSSLKNRSAIQAIDTALFVVCLDNNCNASISPSQFANQIMINSDARNRWFDKPFQLIVTPTGAAGVNGEHSPFDAVIPGEILSQIIDQEEQEFLKSENITKDFSFSDLQPELLNWELSSSKETLNISINEALNNASKLGSSISFEIWHSDVKNNNDIKLNLLPSYGSDWIKEKAKCPPDSFVQIALQLAYFRSQINSKHLCATYESASTRKYLLGRTETIRSCSMEMLNFVKAFENPNEKRDVILSNFKAAVETHITSVRRASSGNGIDRYLLGLQSMLKKEDIGEDAKHLRDLFNDPLVKKSSTYILSTSNMSPGKNLYGGFAPVTSNGYGVNYAIDKTNFKFTISSWNICLETCSKRFLTNLVSVLKDLKIFFEV